MGGATGVQRCNRLGTGLLPCECAVAPTATNGSTFERPAASVPPPPPPPIRVSTTSPTQWSTATTERRWYGWQILVPDIAGGLLSVVGGFVAGPAGIGLAITGSAVALFGGPIVHWAHGHVGRGFGSLFGLRLGLPVLGALLGAGAGVAAGNTTTSVLIGTSIGAGIGSLTGFIVDIAVLAYDPPAAPMQVASDDHPRPRRSRPAVSLAPTIDFMRGDATLVGVAGRF